MKKLIKDPYMPLCVKDAIDDSVDEIWVTIEDSIMKEIGVKSLDKYLK